jgi:hypothetical protein
MSIPSESILGLRMFDNAGDLGAAEERFSFDSLQDALAEATNVAKPFARDSSKPTRSDLSRTIARGSVDASMFSRIFSLALIEPDSGRVTQLYILRDSRAARVNRHD